MKQNIVNIGNLAGNCSDSNIFVSIIRKPRQGQLSAVQKLFNARLRTHRVNVENAIGLVLNTWRKFQYGHNNKALISHQYDQQLPTLNEYLATF